jgi:isoleucyl-tRNA synthetase
MKIIVMQDYKDTLHLPETEFPMRADLAKREPGFLKAWQAQNLYHQVQAARQNAPVFMLHDGPPYATGTLHIGHAANKILKDIVIKSQVLLGRRAPYVPGWDCHGLPIEHVVEKKWGKPGQKLNAAEFRQKCREYAAEQINLQREDFKRLGGLGEWENPYITMDHAYEAEQIRTLAKIYQNGHIKKGYKPVHWCLDCASSLAEAEVEYQDKTSDSITVKYASEQGSVLIWTTTPWTLPANMAVAAGPDIIYVKVRVNEEVLIVAKALLDSVFAGESVEMIGSYTGRELAGLMLQHPFEARQVPLILGEHVTTDAGTGFVHTAPAHGVDDFNISKKYGLEPYHPVASNGCYIMGTPFFEGVHVSKANPLIIAKLQEQGALFRHEKIQHSYPHCWRHKTPLIFRATPQWFISMDKLLPQAIAAAEQVQFTPPEGKNRFMSMLKDRPDWCISRQRTWGVPIPFFTHKQTGALHPDTVGILHQVADAIGQNGLEAWFGADQYFGVNPADYDKATDTLDVWFDSGVSNQCVLEQREGLSFPADLYLEGSDQHRGWFQTSMLASVAATGRAPYRQVLTHGFLVDGQGRKMSKSLGNVVTIQEAVNEYGADIVRLWVCLLYTSDAADDM